MINYLLLLYIFSPLWYYLFHLVAQLWKLAKLDRLLAQLAFAAYGAFAFYEILYIVGLKTPYIFADLIGWYVVPWLVMFPIIYLICKYLNFDFTTRILLSVLTTFVASQTWEISEHVLTIYYHPTLEQIPLTLMLSVPFIILGYPLIYELKKYGRYSYLRYTGTYVVVPIIAGVIFVFLHNRNPADVIFDAKGYLENGVTNYLRIVWAIAYGILFIPLIRTKKAISGNKVVIPSATA